MLSHAGHCVYLDAGHAGWRSSGEMAERLIASGIADAEGFSVNVSNRQSTKDSYTWGRELSDLVGNRDFVIDASRNGVPAPPGAWCNVTPHGLGPPPTTTTRLPGLAALLWVKRPGSPTAPARERPVTGSPSVRLASWWTTRRHPPTRRPRWTRVELSTVVWPFRLIAMDFGASMRLRRQCLGHHQALAANSVSDLGQLHRFSDIHGGIGARGS
jgi:hypothetical protein